MESTPLQPKPILQKPPGYRDPNTLPPPSAKPLPPRKPMIPPSFQPKRKKRRIFCRICCCTFCILLLIMLFVLVIAGGLIYIIFEPSLPEFHLGTFRVPKLNITDLDGAYLDADTTTRVEVKNRNKKIVWHFEQSSVQIWADNGDLNLGSTKAAAFTVNVREMTGVKAETKVRKLALDERQRRRLKGTIDSKALIPSIEVRTRTGVSVKGWKSMMLGIFVVCGDATMRQLDNGAMPLCSLTLFKWIKIK